MTKLTVKTGGGVYDIVSERGGINRLREIWNLDRKVLVVTDDGVPPEYAKTVAAQCKEAFIVTLPQGEATKSAQSLMHLWSMMAEEKMTRTDAVIAVGGGVIGDLSGFAASTYMRGIDFYNVPTTVLSQVDSSVGGKTAIDFGGYKNIVGAFWQPKGVMLDADTLKTLPDRQVSNGLAEAVKMAATFDAELFSYMEKEDISENLESVIVRAVAIKIKVVEEDEREGGLRKVLNFGHTVAHALESRLSFDEMYHGECVAVGMIPMCEGEVRERIKTVLKKVGLPADLPCPVSVLLEAMGHDKKMSGKNLTFITCPEIGKYEMKTLPFEEFKKYMEKAGEDQ